MSTVEEIEAAIARLPREEFFALVGRLRRQHADAWDRQIEEDVAAGRLDALWDSAKSEIEAGKTVGLNEILGHQRLP